MLPWLGNPDNPAMSSHAEGRKGTRHTDIVYKVGKGRLGGGGMNQKLCWNVEWRYNKQEGATRRHVDNRRPLNAQAYQR